MVKKPLVIATVAAAMGMATISTQAAAGDPVLGALIGGGIGAAIGHEANGHHGAAVGGVLGAIVGSSIAAESGPYYYGDPYYAPAPAYYPPPAPVYYEPAPPVYYGPSVVLSAGPYYGHRHYVRREWRGEHRDWHR